MKKTLENLSKAFIGESQARNRYTLYSKTAKKEGYEQLADIFLVTADNEREHAKWLFRLIQELKEDSGEDLEALTVEAEAPLVLGTTADNLIAAIAGEHYEYSEMYPEFADVAEEEGLEDIAVRLRAIGRAEEHHEDRYKKLLGEVEAGTMFKKDEEVKWVCRKCGYVHTGMEPPEKCPACDHPTKYYEILCEQY
ncbi:rubrerythrin [Methanobacterium congolense]|uniref:Putative rubrerythrin n=1 Tax=Methanobacterium congolense TaxID=118062 RepID=A0A1D3L2H8_9EURY|nr:rubrerythrin family protein [Methanobacterium congolense]SCG85821.1 putative rubrerythrin [Methanobacterium congolense]